MQTKQILTVWFPRVLAVVYTLFIALLSFDVFGSDASIGEKIGGFLTHNIPTFILLFALYLSWKNSFKGGIAFIIVSILFTISFRTFERWDAFVLISAPLLLIGILFLLGQKKNS